MSKPSIDPKVGMGKYVRVLRGGSWRNSIEHCRAAYRSWLAPANRYDYCGFRILMEIKDVKARR